MLPGQHKRPRGHSNLYPDETVPCDTCPEKASIPMVGGAYVWSCKPLPPLALSREEWEEIGRRMGWIGKKPRKAVSHVQ